MKPRFEARKCGVTCPRCGQETIHIKTVRIANWCDVKVEGFCGHCVEPVTWSSVFSHFPKQDIC